MRLSLLTKISARDTTVIFSKQVGTVLPIGTSVASKFFKPKLTPGWELKVPSKIETGYRGRARLFLREQRRCQEDSRKELLLNVPSYGPLCPRRPRNVLGLSDHLAVMMDGDMDDFRRVIPTLNFQSAAVLPKNG